jgi:CDP-diacylglycerol--serine O-phosphatidyltransferase
MLTFSDVFQRRLLWGIGVLYAVSAFLRLARFNVQKNEHQATSFFQGLPTPAAAGMLASFAIARPALEQLAEPLMADPTRELGVQLISVTMVGVPLVTVALAWLMVSRIRYPHIARELARRRSFSQLVEVVFALVITVTLHELALPLLFCYFVFAPPVNQLRMRATGQVVTRDAPQIVKSEL